MFTAEEESMMRLALQEAALAAEQGEVPAGAILLDPQGRVAGRGRNRVIGLCDPTAHAEILAIREAAIKTGNYRLAGFKLFSTLEPCPMCLMAAIHCRLESVVFGAPEPRWGAAGSLVDLASLPGLNHRLRVTGGLLAEECGGIISTFFKNKRAAASGRRREASMLEIGKKFPEFALPDQNGESRCLADYAGNWAIIYFYPKDNTSACTLEAQDFSASAKKFAARKAAIVGVSPDSVKSHAGFMVKKDLDLTLLSDPEHVLLVAAGVWAQKKMYGREYMGVERTTVVVDPKGVVREVWSKVKVPGHVEKVLARLVELQADSK